MKNLARPATLGMVICFAAMHSLAADFHTALGLQLWSLREQTKTGVPGALDLVTSYGVTEVETAGTGNLTALQFAGELKSRGLVAVSAHVGYETLQEDIAAVIRDAQALGVEFVVCPWIPHAKSGLTADDARRVAAEFNVWGAACQAAGLRFGYHPHGFEFEPAGPGETVFDVLARETKPNVVCFEMDVFWVVHAGQDPVKLLRKYPDRWRLLHLKDLRKGVATGFSTGSAPSTDNVAIGDGQIDWRAVLATAQGIGVEHYFIEDETPAPLQSIPASLQYLRTLKL
jgi:sugar phosphate isomerase/epimerase